MATTDHGADDPAVVGRLEVFESDATTAPRRVEEVVEHTVLGVETSVKYGGEQGITVFPGGVVIVDDGEKVLRDQSSGTEEMFRQMDEQLAARRARVTQEQKDQAEDWLREQVLGKTDARVGAKKLVVVDAEPTEPATGFGSVGVHLEADATQFEQAFERLLADTKRLQAEMLEQQKKVTQVLGAQRGDAPKAELDADRPVFKIVSNRLHHDDLAARILQPLRGGVDGFREYLEKHHPEVLVGLTEAEKADRMKMVEAGLQWAEEIEKKTLAAFESPIPAVPVLQGGTPLNLKLGVLPVHHREFRIGPPKKLRSMTEFRVTAAWQPVGPDAVGRELPVHDADGRPIPGAVCRITAVLHDHVEAELTLPTDAQNPCRPLAEEPWTDSALPTLPTSRAGRIAAEVQKIRMALGVPPRVFLGQVQTEEQVSGLKEEVEKYMSGLTRFLALGQLGCGSSAEAEERPGQKQVLKCNGTWAWTPVEELRPGDVCRAGPGAAVIAYKGRGERMHLWRPLTEDEEDRVFAAERATAR